MAIELYDLAGAEDDRRFSPYCWRIKLALAHKGLEFETIPWRFHEKSRLIPLRTNLAQCVGAAYRSSAVLSAHSRPSELKSLNTTPVPKPVLGS